jgi:hypothetical protein
MSATATLRPSEITDRTFENRALEARTYEVSNKYFDLADRVWLAEIEDAAALLDLEDRLFLFEIEARTYRTA